MGWQDRDYSKDTWTEQGSAGPSLRWPSRGAGILIVLHIAAFALVKVIGSEGGEAIVATLALSGAAAHPAGLLLHPLATPEILTLILTVLILWTLAGRVEQQFGPGRMIRLYLVGNLLAGLAFFPMARFVPQLAGVELDYPAGAFAAWCVLAYRAMSGEMIPLFGRLRRTSRVVGIGAALVVGLMLAFRGLGAIGWLAALVAGGLAEPAAERLPALLARRSRRRRRRRVRPSVPREHPPEVKRPDEPDIDEILAKISQSGLDSLTREERERLEAARQAKLRESQDLNAMR